MKKSTAVVITALALGLPAITLLGQDGNPPPPRPERPRQLPREGDPQAAPGDQAQRPPPRPRDGQPGGAPNEGQRPRQAVPPLFAALDANHDGTIDETEIANAAGALRKLDKNGDGKLSMDELRPPRPAGHADAGAAGDPEPAHRPGNFRQDRDGNNPPPPPGTPRAPRPPSAPGSGGQ